MRMCRIAPGESTCDPADPAQALDVGEYFAYPGWGSYGGLFSGVVRLKVIGEAFAEGSYLIRLLAGGSTPLESEQNERLEDDVDVYLRVVAEDAPWQMVSIESNTLEEGLEEGYYRPHHPLQVRFSVPMQVINFAAEPLAGFYFRYLYDEGDSEHPVGIASRSAQGLLPGQQYRFSIFSEDALPNGIPWTMDPYGNVLYESTDGAVRAASYSRSFETSHVRIYFPYQSANSPEPAPWLEEQRLIGQAGELFLLVEVYQDVDLLTAAWPQRNRKSHIAFPDRPVTLADKTDDLGRLRERSVIRIDIDPEAIDECAKTEDGYNYTMEIGHRQTLEVFAWRFLPGGGKEFLGSDRIQVDPLPEDFDPGFPQPMPGYSSGYYYINDNPSNDEGGYKDELNGVAHDKSNWYFANNMLMQHVGRVPVIWKIPKYIRLNRDVIRESPEEGIFNIVVYDIPQLSYYNHIGDIDARDNFIYATLEDSPGHRFPPALTVFYTSPSHDEDIHYVGHVLIPNGTNSAPWCAYNPLDGRVYTSESDINPGAQIHGYKLEIDYDPVTEHGNVELNDEESSSILLRSGNSNWTTLPPGNGYSWELQSMQGGVFSEAGNLYLVHGYFDTFGWGGIWVFNLEGAIDWSGNLYYYATAVDRSSQGDENAPFQFSCGGAGDEPEGIDIWDLSLDPIFSVLHLYGQIHVIMINNVGENGDDWYFKHYSVRSENKCKI